MYPVAYSSYNKIKNIIVKPSYRLVVKKIFARFVYWPLICFYIIGHLFFQNKKSLTLVIFSITWLSASVPFLVQLCHSYTKVPKLYIIFMYGLTSDLYRYQTFFCHVYQYFFPLPSSYLTLISKVNSIVHQYPQVPCGSSFTHCFTI